MNTTIPAGTRLFHGTCEPFAFTEKHAGELRASGDGMFWCAKDSAISQCYIPVAGAISHLRMDSLLEPSFNQGDVIHWLQQKAGLEFRNVTWVGSRPQSYGIAKEPFPYEWTDDIDERHIRQTAAKVKTLELFRTILQDELGYTPTNHSENPAYTTWEIKTQREGDITAATHANWRQPGKLIILETLKDLNFHDIAQGQDGDLTEPDHLKYQLFEKIIATGLDGILINDFAQVDDIGNFGHSAIGICGNLGDKIKVIAQIDAVHPEGFRTRHYLPDDYQSIEYKTWNQNGQSTPENQFAGTGER